MSDSPGTLVEPPVVEATSEPEGATPQPGTALETPEAPPSPESEPAGAEAPASPEAQPTQPAAVTPFQPPDGGKPFTWELDGAAIPLPGAVEVDDYLIVPKQSLQQLRYQIGNKTQWGRERAEYQRTIHELESGQARQADEASLRTKALTAKFAELFADPEKLRAAYENWGVEGPILQAKAEAEAAHQQLQRYQQQEEARSRAEQEKQLEPVVRDELGVAVEEILGEMGATTLLAGPDGKYPQETQEMFAHLWEMVQKGYALVTLGRDGRFQADRDEIYRLLHREVQKQQRKQEQTKQVQKTKATNAAAVAPTKPAGGPTRPAPQKPRDEQGKFKPEEPFDPQEYVRKVKFLEP